MNTRIFLLAVFSFLVVACEPSHSQPKTTTTESSHMEKATLAGGCFWCIEAVFQRLEGVDTVISGYTGGSAEDADYKKVSTGQTDHAEACQITFDPAVVSYEDILHVFFSAHDPTTLNRQGNDVGPQYRSAIFYHSPEQETTAREYIEQLTANNTWPDAIVTQVAEYTEFYTAEEYHQNYYNENGSQPYCAFVVRPKVEKFMKKFESRLKEEYR